MRLQELLFQLRRTPLIASVQADRGTPLHAVGALVRLARCSHAEGARVFRVEGVSAIRAIERAVGGTIVGLIKRRYPASEVYITPTAKEVGALLESPCEVIALDGTQRPRPRESLVELIRMIRDGGRLALADCDGVVSAIHAVEAGADLIATTLVPPQRGRFADPRVENAPNLDALREIVGATKSPCVAEGRFTEPWQVEAALRIGAVGVAIGGALNDPIKQTRRLRPRAPYPNEVGAADIGGTWLRLGVFDPDWKLVEHSTIPCPPAGSERVSLVAGFCRRKRLVRAGIASGGTVAPRNGRVWEAKEMIPNHVGVSFGAEEMGIEAIALNDGLATAWGHACLPEFAGKKVATLTIGTGVGFGLVDRMQLVMGPQGEYPRLADCWTSTGRTVEEALGGATLGTSPSAEALAVANRAAQEAVGIIATLCMPEVIVVAGGVGLAEWIQWEDVSFRAGIPWCPIVRSPFGEWAGLYGAASLALYPPPPFVGVAGRTVATNDLERIGSSDADVSNVAQTGGFGAQRPEETR